HLQCIWHTPAPRAEWRRSALSEVLPAYAGVGTSTPGANLVDCDVRSSAFPHSILVLIVATFVGTLHRIRLHPGPRKLLHPGDIQNGLSQFVTFESVWHGPGAWASGAQTFPITER